MKTYERTIKAPLLEIRHDENGVSPRNDDNLGYFISVDRSYYSPDDHDTLVSIVKETGGEARNQEEHIRMIKKEVEDQVQEKVLAIYPITKYEHGGVNYSLGRTSGFDYSANGFYIVTDKTAEVTGVSKENFEKVIKEELNIYNKYANGEVYCYTLFDEDGEVQDSCGGFYDIEDIKEQLPKEWEDVDLEEYYTD